MGTTLHQLYCGSLIPQEEYLTVSQGADDTFEYHKQRFNKLLEMHAPELLKGFDVLMDDLVLTYNDDTERAFCQGFGLAVKLITEGMAC